MSNYDLESEPTIDLYGTKYWRLNGKFHRLDGPAIEWAIGDKSWYLDDNLHRVEGPAIEYSNGTKEWYLYGRWIKQSYYYALLKLRKFRSRISIFNSALGLNFAKTLKLSRNKTIIEWYYSPDNGGGQLAKTRLEQFISSTNPI